MAECQQEFLLLPEYSSDLNLQCGEYAKMGSALQNHYDTLDGRNPANQLLWEKSHHLQSIIHPRWCRISSINISSTTQLTGWFGYNTSVRCMHRPEQYDSWPPLPHPKNTGETSQAGTTFEWWILQWPVTIVDYWQQFLKTCWGLRWICVM